MEYTHGYLKLPFVGVRVFRTLKFFHVFRKTKQINIIFQTFIQTLPAIINIGSLLLLIFFIFGILAQNLFADIML